MDWEDLVAGSRGFSSLRAVVVGSDDRQAATAATVKWARSQAPGSVAMIADPAPPSPGRGTLTIDTSYIWLVPPSRWRFEHDTPDLPGRFIQIVNRPRWWTVSRLADPPVASGEDYLGVSVAEEPPLAAMWDLSKLAEELTIEEGDVDRVQPHQVRLRAATKPDLEEEYWPGAWNHELLIDRERGVVLSWVASDGDVFVGSRVVREIVFDEPLDDSLFEGPPEESPAQS